MAVVPTAMGCPAGHWRGDLEAARRKHGHSMKLTLGHGLVWLILLSWVEVATVRAAAQRSDAGGAASGQSVLGEVVDPEIPAAYRLPVIEVAQRTGALFSPPDDSRERVARRQGARRSWDGGLPEPIGVDLTKQLMPAVQRGFGLAKRGALFAAREEFVQVLRRVAQARDAAENVDRHSVALAAGLRALSEADDFVPDGIQLEAELDVEITASSHRTPVLDQRSGLVLAQEAVALYHRYAEEQLTLAAAGEQAGSMALYGLGQINARLAERSDQDVHYVRTAIAMYAASLAARPDNHLAANELGVLLCQTGQARESVALFQRTIDLAPSATAYHNLAVAQSKLGLHAEARANEQESHRIAERERAGGVISQRAGIRWVEPEEMARVARPGPWSAPSGAAAGGTMARAPNRARWR